MALARLIGSRFPAHKNLKNNFSHCFNAVCDGFDEAVRRCTNLDVSSDLIIVIRPMWMGFDVRHSAISFSICASFDPKSRFVISSLFFLKLIPKYLQAAYPLNSLIIFISCLLRVTICMRDIFLYSKVIQRTSEILLNSSNASSKFWDEFQELGQYHHHIEIPPPPPMCDTVSASQHCLPI